MAHGVNVTQLILQGGIGGVSIVILLLLGLQHHRNTRSFLDFLGSERQARDQERKEEREDRKTERESFVATIKEIGSSFDQVSKRIEHCPHNTKTHKEEIKCTSTSRQ